MYRNGDLLSTLSSTVTVLAFIGTDGPIWRVHDCFQNKYDIFFTAPHYRPHHGCRALLRPWDRR